MGPALLVLETTGRELRPEDVEALEAAAAPLVAELHRLGLVSAPAGPQDAGLGDTGPSTEPADTEFADTGPSDTGPSSGPDTGKAAPTTKEPA